MNPLLICPNDNTALKKIYVLQAGIPEYQYGVLVPEVILYQCPTCKTVCISS